MGLLHAHRHHRGLGRGRALIAAWSAWVWAAEIALTELPPGAVMLVDAAPASHGAEARDLEAGARVVTLIQSDGRKVFQRVVLLSADERVELDLEEINAEVWRGKVKPKAAVDAAKVPALIDVVVIDRQVRVLLDGQPMPFDDVRERYQATVDAGEHRLEATVSGRVRSASTVRVAGRPWRCVASVEGALRCDEVADLDALPPLDVAALNQRLRTLAPRLRAQAIIDEVGRADCVAYASLLQHLADDSERLMVLREVRGRVIDPWNRAALVATVTFPDSRREIEAFFPVE